jgi:hypothetical protein
LVLSLVELEVDVFVTTTVCVPRKQEQALLAREVCVLPVPQFATNVGSGALDVAGVDSSDVQKL